jgi:hypothetical protein
MWQQALNFMYVNGVQSDYPLGFIFLRAVILR